MDTNPLTLHKTIFADDSFSKPYLVTYVNTSFFSVFLPLILARRLWNTNGSIMDVLYGKGEDTHYAPLTTAEHEAFLKPNSPHGSRNTINTPQVLSEREGSTLPDEAIMHGKTDSVGDKLSVRETAKLGLEFSILWVSSMVRITTYMANLMIVCGMAYLLKSNDLPNDEIGQLLCSSMLILYDSR